MPAEWENLANDPEIKPLLGVNYMRHAERKSESAEVEAIERKLTDPVERRFLQNPGKLKQQNDRRKANLAAQSPPTDLRPSQRDKLERLEILSKAFILDGPVPMPSYEQNRHNDAGAADYLRAWQSATKSAVLAWQATRILLHPGSDERDLANFHRYQPHEGSTRNLYVNAQIPGQFALSPQAKENYPAINWESPDVQAKIDELIERGLLKVRMRGASARPTAVCCPVEGCGSVYSGKSAHSNRANLARHTKAKHGVREEVPA